MGIFFYLYNSQGSDPQQAMKNKYQILSIHIQEHVKKTNYNTTHDTEILLRGNWF